MLIKDNTITSEYVNVYSLNDKKIGINWDINFEPVLSDKDKVQPCFEDINLEELK